MKKKFNTRVSVLFSALGIGTLSAFAQAPAPVVTAASPPAATGTPAAVVLQLADNAPSRYEVKKGDTLWGIAGRYLKSPWRWNELWRMNKEQIRNPHRIYPGNVLVLSNGPDGQPQLNIGVAIPERETVRVPLQVRVTPIDGDAISSRHGQVAPVTTRGIF